MNGRDVPAVRRMIQEKVMLFLEVYPSLHKEMVFRLKNLPQLRGTLLKSHLPCLKHTKAHDRPKGPRQFQHLPQFILFVFFRKSFASSWVGGSGKAASGIFGKDIKDSGHQIGKNIHKNGNPKHPREITHFLDRSILISDKGKGRYDNMLLNIP